MNKLTLMTMLLAVIAATKSTLGLMTAPPSSKTPSIPHSSRRPRTQAKVPNDGRWHMKHHRNRK